MNSAKNVQSATKTDRSDALLRKRVEAALERDRGLQGLEVVDVDHGVVHMKATGVTITGKLRAVQLAWDAAEQTEQALSGPDRPPAAGSGNSADGAREKHHDLAYQTSDRAAHQRRGER